ncbi:unnamed protein product [Caenorhabditis angaria]|uniref:Uncharacterized protein n=1 Tax=Caenorhabditis angaria TaxID=860376 RepID=A0A9P1J4D1_9PELO|nr:unnamed protein product [Caenorhabditis angaria]
MPGQIPKKALTRAQRKINAESQNKCDELNPNRPPGSYLFTPPRNAGGATTTEGNSHFKRFTSGEESNVEEVVHPVDAPAGVNNGANVPNQQPPVAAVAPQIAADAPNPIVAVDVVRAEGVVAAGHQAVEAPPSVASSADETEGDEAIAEALAQEARRQRRRRRRRQARRRQNQYNYERPEVLMADPHQGEVIIDEFLPMAEDATQTEESE